MTSYNVIIPAHNEVALIADTLRYLFGGGDTPSDDVQVMVVCNGCTDGTAQAARDAGLPAEIVELQRSGKANAINHALACLPPGTTFVMDADVRMRLSGFDRMAEALATGSVDAISPVPHYRVDRSTSLVRRYFRAYSRHPYLARGVGGSGIWGVSASARAALGALPEVISDDNYVRAFFPADRQARVAFDRNIGPQVQIPRTLEDLLRCEARWRSGDVQLATLPGLSENRRDARFRLGDLATTLRRNWADPTGIVAYLGVKIIGRAKRLGHQASRRDHLWHRDEGSREPAPAGPDDNGKWRLD